MRKPTSAETIFHSIRHRIVTIFEAGQRRMSINELIAMLGDVPQASVYRHMSILVEAGLLEVVATRTVGRVQESVYAIPDIARLSMRDDVRARGRAGMAETFSHFVNAVRSQFARTASRPDVDLEKDRILLLQVPLFLSDADVDEIREFAKRVEAKRTQGPAPNRTLRAITLFDFPLAEGGAFVEPPRRPKTHLHIAGKKHQRK